MSERRRMKLCKFEGMTRAQYNANMEAVKALCRPHFRRAPDLNPDGTPDIAAMLRRVKVKGSAFGLPEFGMYRSVERPKTQAREMARRRRQMGV